MNRPRSSIPSPWLWAVGAGLLVFAARLETMRRGAAEAPFLDQWLVEADQIIAPWLRGQLEWKAFFAPHHEHYPVWTRLFAWLEAALLRCWDPLVQGTVNAAAFGIFAASFVRWTAENFPKLVALIFAALFVTLYALPHSWENAIWGFQSSVPVCLLFVFWHIRGSIVHATGTIPWWLGQASGVLALGSFGGAWAAPLAVALVSLWNDPRNWRRWTAPAAIATAGIALLFHALHAQPAVGALAQHASDIRRFLGAFLLQVGWPSPLLFAAAVLPLPAFLLALQLRHRRDAAGLDLAIVALACFGLGQAAAIGIGRSAGYLGFVPRYADFLALGVAANALALWRLWLGRAAPRWWTLPLMAGWLTVVVMGLVEINTTGHTKYFREHAGIWAAERTGAVKQYIATHDRAHLAATGARTFLYPEPATVAQALDTPGMVALLPASLRADPASQPGDTAGLAARFLTNAAPELAWSGGLLVLLALVMPARSLIPAPLTPRPDPVRVPLIFAIAIASGGAVFLWPMPTVVGTETRLIRLVSTPESVGDFRFRIVTPTKYPPDNLEGGAGLWPEHFRNVFYGTHIDGPGFTGRAESTLFELTSPYLLVPLAGYPATAGNGLLIEILDGASQVVSTHRYNGENPTTIAYWGVDVTDHQGRTARVVLLDGQSTGTESWVAAAPPQRVERNLASERTAAWEAERTANARFAFGAIALLALALGWDAWRMNRRTHPRELSSR